MSKHIKKWYRNEAEIHEKSAPEVNKKRCLKTNANKSQKSQKNTSKWTPNIEYVLRGNASWSTFAGSDRFCNEKIAPPALPKCAQERKISQK